MTNGRWILIAGIVGALTGCDATVELTKAPFDATTALSGGVTDATHELVQPTTEFTSSTTPGADGPNSPARARKKLELFAKYSVENLRTDVARGDGEYLASLAALAGVPQDRHEDFRLQMRHAYSTLFDDTLSGPESSARLINAAWAMGLGQGR
ncbi:DUF3015 family protein [Nitrospira moscoviensis]|uniref:DUF3015 domain-containing protein n=1 Tax=Nitrospira moscoviensis TaxID=42253 RepID=A0A0K2GDQ1_NITMO|nr:DUF3015 family protein [Nitrospira moscoviensis]ALA59085.1 hypothetical protein NITMOv2_2672 [Nitrospira moscoviensis]